LIRSANIAFSVNRLTEGVDDTSEEIFANRDRKELASRFALHAFGDVLSVTEKHDPDFTFLKVKGESGQSAGKFDHLVQLGVAESFDLSDSVTGFTDNADIGFFNGRRDVRDLGFQFLENAAHDKYW
jgi:hypothetical protein